MRILRSILVPTGCAAAALAAYVLLHSRADPERHQVERARLESSLEAAPVAAAPPSYPDFAPKSGSVNQPAAPRRPPASGPQRGPSPALPDEGRRVDEVRDNVKYLYQRQPLDASWSRDARATLQETLGKFESKDSRIKSVDCRTSICRVEFGHDDESAYFGFLRRAFEPGKFDWPAEFLVTKDSSDREPWAMVMYLARDGTSLPKLE